ncbi:hypothetical protein GH714_011490 [Hevea brasiliensis]|uniref:Peptidase metallopeptidase domain-containing protein n=1 Tax=Hevea brasiliensis TaxID=3981 RepID=A0A6A6M7Y2_HEVBR|nr:hypothetical protein GH714_011490 [Hevea brasiliensis]
MLRWPSSKYQLTYMFRSGVQNPNEADMRSACSQAFQRWASVSQFTFQEAPTGSRADILIGFYRGDHGDGDAFDGPLGKVLARAFYPQDGRFHMMQMRIGASRILKSEDQTLKSLQILEEVHKGQTIAGLNKVKKYLNKFGFYANPNDSNLTDDFDDHLESALKTSSVPDDQDFRSAFAQAFQSWEGASQFKFKEASADEKANIVIWFYSGDHGDGLPFDGPGRVLAHSFFPQDGRSHYDADESWSTNPDMNHMDLESVALHELGHVLGLAHSQDPNAVMHSGIAAGTIKRDLTQDDIEGIQALYPN